MKRPLSRRGGPVGAFPFAVLRNQAAGSGNEMENVLDDATVRDIADMTNECPAIRVATKTLLAMVLPGPFTYSIPKLGIVPSEEMHRIIVTYWMPWARDVWQGCKRFGVCPWFYVWRGDHQVPQVPDFTTGYIAVVTDVKTRQKRYRWYDMYSDTSIGQGPMREAAKDMYWAVTEDAPASDGTLRSAAATLLSQWRSLCKLQQARDVVATQRAHPPHLMEHVPNPKEGQDQDLAFMSADYGAAAGIGQQRLEESRHAQERRNASRLKKALKATQATNINNSTVQKTLWTDAPQALLDEMDAGFGNRVVVINAGYRYREAAKPEIVADYEKVLHEFNIMAAAVYDSNIEFFTPSGGSRAAYAHQASMIDRFTNGRIREQSQFFERIIQAALVIAYRPQFREIMDKANTWRAARFKGSDVSELGALHPELDVVVQMPKSAVAAFDELSAMRDAGIITQETMNEYIAQGKNMPITDFVTLQWPDNVPHERLVKPPPGSGAGTLGSGSSTSTSSGKPAKKKPAIV